MQPTETFSVQRRALDVEDYIDILRRHKGWIFGPFLLTLTCSVVGIYLWPDSYQSVAAVQIRPQQVPESLVKSAVSQDMTQRLTSIQNTITSRTTLTSIIRNHDLYKREVASRPIEEVVETMRGAISIIPLVMGNSNRASAFQVKFSYRNKRDAQQVVQDLVTKFMDQNQKDRGTETHNTQGFVQDRTDLAEKELMAADQKLSDFRIKNAGRLPDQLDSNLQSLRASQESAQSLSNQLSRISSERASYETELRIAKEKIESLTRESQVVPKAPEVQKSPKLQAAERDVDNANDRITLLLQQVKETHPDVKQARSTLAALITRRDNIAREDERARAAAPVAGPVVNIAAQRDVQDLRANVSRLETAIDQKEREQAQLEKQVKITNEQITAINSRVQSIPVGDQEYAQLLREQQLAAGEFRKWKEILSTATGAADMENRQQGETLDILDPASLPERATDPNRGLFISMGAGLGLLLGVVIAGAREMKDTSLKNLKDVRAYTQMSILGSVPLLENDFVVRRRKRMAWLGWTTACLLAVVAMGGAIVYYYTVTVQS